MTAKELIAALQSVDPGAEVVFLNEGNVMEPVVRLDDERDLVAHEIEGAPRVVLS